MENNENIEKEENIENTNDMSDTFISEVGQKDAISTGDTEMVPVEEIQNELGEGDSAFPKVDIAPPGEEEKKIDLDAPPSEEIMNQKPVKEPKEKKGGKGFAFIMLLLGIALGGAAGYFGYSYLNDTDTPKVVKKEKKEVKEEKLNVEGNFVKDLVSKYDLDNTTIEEINLAEYTTLFKDEEVLASAIDKDYVKYVSGIDAYRGLYNNQSFTSEELKESVKKLFGDKVQVEDEDIIYPYSDPKLVVMTYNKNDNNYSHTKSSENKSLPTSTIGFKRKIVDAVKKDNNVTITVAIAILDTESDKVYQVSDAEGKLDKEVEGLTASTIDMSKDYKKFNNYKYSYIYDSATDNYLLDSIKLVK